MRRIALLMAGCVCVALMPQQAQAAATTLEGKCVATGVIKSDGTTVRLRPCQSVQDLHGCTYTLIGFQETDDAFDRACFEVAFGAQKMNVWYCAGLLDAPVGILPPLSQHCLIPPKVVGVSVKQGIVDLTIPQQIASAAEPPVVHVGPDVFNPGGDVLTFPTDGTVGDLPIGPGKSGVQPTARGDVSVPGPTANGRPTGGDTRGRTPGGRTGGRETPGEFVWWPGLANLGTIVPIIPQDLDHDGIPDATDPCVCSACGPVPQESNAISGYFGDTVGGNAAKAAATYYRVTGRKRTGIAMDELMKTVSEAGPTGNFQYVKANGGPFDMTPHFDETVAAYPESDCVIVDMSCGEPTNQPAGNGFVCQCLDPDGDRVCSETFGSQVYNELGAPKISDNCPQLPNLDQQDSDADGIGDACEEQYIVSAAEGTNQIVYGLKPRDTDADGVPDYQDICPAVADPDQATCGDYFGCACSDQDEDGVLDWKLGAGQFVPHDNCATIANPMQKDSDNDGRGDACEPCPTVALTAATDPDGDGLESACDNCPGSANVEQDDLDGDGTGNKCDSDFIDVDGDIVPDQIDNCKQKPNPTQSNSDKPTGSEVFPQDFKPDAYGDACDNCPFINNGSQQDSDGDKTGDACDETPCGPGGGGWAFDPCTCFTAVECQAWKSDIAGWKKIKAKL